MKTYTETEQKTISKAVANNISKVKPVPMKTPTVQMQLKIGKPNDEYEQEADRVADRVMSMPESSVQQQPIEEEEEELMPKLQLQPLEEEEEMLQPKSAIQLQPLEEEEEMLQTKPKLQLQPLEEEEEMLQTKPKLQLQPLEEEEEMLQAKPMIQMQVEEEEEEMVQTKPMLQLQPMEEEEEMLQPKWIQKAGCSSCEEKEMAVQTSPEPVQMSPLSHIDSCGGQTLPDSSRGFFESRMGYNFGNVRVHTCDSAVQMNQQLGAQAFTYGNNIFFNKDKFSPGSSDGKKLLAHELTHVVQQNGGLKRIDKKKQFYIQPYRQKKSTGNHNITAAPHSIQRALPVAAALAIVCAIGAIVGMLLDWGIMYGWARIRGREYRHDWCGTILAGILGCLGGISAAGVEAYMARTSARLIIGGPIIGRILSWLVAQTSVLFPRQAALSLLRLGCINEEQHEVISE